VVHLRRTGRDLAPGSRPRYRYGMKVTAGRASSDPALAKKARLMLLLSVGITLVLYLLPYGHHVAYPLVLISTLVHELGHGVTATLVGGHFEQFRMFADGSGVALWRGDVGAGARGLIAAGGLVGPPLGAAVFFVAARRPSTARACLGVFGALLVLASILVVRNGFGWLFVGLLAAACLVLALRAGPDLVQLAVVFLAVQLALSSYSRSDYLFTRYAETSAGRMPSDVEHMAQALILPYWFWGGLCAAFSLLVIALGGWTFLRGARRARAA
jgi:hypothetical protein